MKKKNVINIITLGDNYFLQEIQLEQKIKWFPSPQMQCPQMEEINEWKLKVDEVDPNEDCSFFSGELEKSYQEAKVYFA